MHTEIPAEERGRIVTALLLATAGSMAVAEAVRAEHPTTARAVQTVTTSYASLVALFWMILKEGEINA